MEKQLELNYYLEFQQSIIREKVLGNIHGA